MKITLETKFNFGDVVMLKSEHDITGTKMVICTVILDSNKSITYLCEWTTLGSGHRMAFCEDSLKLGEKKGD